MAPSRTNGSSRTSSQPPPPRTHARSSPPPTTAENAAAEEAQFKEQTVAQEQHGKLNVFQGYGIIDLRGPRLEHSIS